MNESWHTRLRRWGFNFFPAYRGTGARFTYIAADWREVRIKLPLNWRTRNYVGTIYGGSMYGAVDPIYMVMLIQLLGPQYIVWDKAATHPLPQAGQDHAHRPFRGRRGGDGRHSRQALAEQPSLDRVYTDRPGGQRRRRPCVGGEDDLYPAQSSPVNRTR